MKTIIGFAIAIVLALNAVWADGHGSGDGHGHKWVSLDEQSIVAFGSIKKDVIGEVHHFNAVAGSISAGGEVLIEVDLSSVDTSIEIRDERMHEHVFNRGGATAVLRGQMAMDGVMNLAVGDSATTDFEGALAFAGNEVDIAAQMLVARLRDDRLLVTTADIIMLSTADLGIDAGIDALREIANLPSITRVTPITVRMVFER